MRKRILLLMRYLPVAALVAIVYAPATGSAQVGRPVQFSVEPEALEVRPGEQIAIKIHVDLQPGWHIYSTTMPADTVGPRPTEIGITEPEGAELLAVEADREPTVQFDPTFAIQTEYFEEKVTWTLKVALPQTLSGGETALRGYVRYQLCTAEQCLPPSKYEFVVNLRVSGPAGAVAPAATKTEAKAPQPSTEGAPAGERQPDEPANESAATGQIASLPAALGFGFLAGLILNVMPCVLPVLSLKIYGFVQQQGVSDTRRKLLALTFAAGIIVVFLALAVIAMALSLGWGQQFQSKGFVAAMVGLLVAFALGMFDVYTIQLPGTVSRLESELAHEETYLASFAKGMLATVLATPCSGPFLGGVLTFAVQQPPYIVLAVFASIGLGMASPYILLAWFPGWLRFMPRPGEWMNTMKELMAFLLFGAAVWLLWVHRRDGEFVVWTVAFALFVGFACWLYGKLAHPLASPVRRRLAPVAAILVIAAGWGICFSGGSSTPATEPTGRAIAAETPTFDRTFIEQAIDKGLWLEYRRELLDRLLREGYSVIVDWTADW